MLQNYIALHIINLHSICSLTVQHQTLDHSEGNNLTHPMLILELIFDLKITVCLIVS